MKLIYKIETNSNLNKKAEVFAKLIQLYEGLMFLSNDDFDHMLDGVRQVLSSLNAEYPKTRPFELYGVSRYSVYICVKEAPDKSVAQMLLTEVQSVYNREEGLMPISDYSNKNAK